MSIIAAVNLIFWFDSHHMFLSPQLIYPLKEMSLSCSIFMMVTLATERAIAIYKPFSRSWKNLTSILIAHNRLNPGNNNNRSILLKYSLLVLLTSAALNSPKFLETTSSWGPRAVFNISCNGETMKMVETRVQLSVTWLRLNITYFHVSSMIRWVKEHLLQFHLGYYMGFISKHQYHTTNAVWVLMAQSLALLT